MSQRQHVQHLEVRTLFGTASVSADTMMTVPGMPIMSPRKPAIGGETAAAPIVIV